MSARSALHLLRDPELAACARWLLRRSPGKLALLPGRLLRASRAPATPPLPDAEGAKPPALRASGAMPPEEVVEIATLARRLAPAEVAAVVEEADAAARGKIALWPGLVVDAERADGWDARFDDPEALMRLHRWYHAAALAKASAYTGSDGYAEAYVRLFADWRARYPSPSDHPAYGSYTVSERIANMALADEILVALGSRAYASERRAFLDHLAEQAEHLAANLEDREVHNHLLNNARALVLYGVKLRGERGAEAAFHLGWRLLTREAGRQFLADGLLWEQSSHYHVMVVTRVAECALAVERAGGVVDPRLARTLRSAFESAAWLTRPDGTLVTYGDVSPDAGVDAVAGCAAIGGAFGAPVPRPPGEAALWLLGARRARELPAVERPRGVRAFPASGLGVVADEGAHVVLRCDPSGGPLRHGHMDALGLDAWISGVHVLVDPGTPSFEPRLGADAFRGPRLHSSLTVDGRTPFVRSSLLRRAVPEFATRGARAPFPVEGGLAAGHEGYARLARPVALRREVRTSPDGLDVLDLAEGEGAHTLCARFHLPAASASSRPGGASAAVGARRVELDAEADGRPLPVRVEEGAWSPRYGVAERSVVLRVDLPFRGRATLLTRLRIA